MERSSLPVALPSSDAIGSELMLLAANESSDDQTRPRSAAPSGQQAPELRAKPDLAEAATQNGHETCPRALMAEFPGHQGVPACLASDLSIRLCRNVARNRESPIRAAEEPPLLQQVALAERIAVARNLRPRMTWDEIAEAEGVPKRTLQHFYRRWLDGLGRRRRRTNAERELARRLERMENTRVW